LLFVDCPPPESHRELPFVTADNYTASREVGAHLAAHGYRRWGFIGHTGTWTTRQPREQGFVDAAAACGAQVAVIEGANDSDSARRAVLAHLSARPRPEWPEALYAANTPLLHGTMLALRERGLRVPDDMALVAFDDFEWAPMLDPPLTVVDQRIEEIGAAAGRQILLQLAEEPIPEAERARIVRPVLRLRRSCGCRHG
ncbi:MAG TPA: substrate-binding domain-containing protein, partial [Alphaproteobacteria bacterium]|nr:substrate-binding domain-containing protein [Alphaproteobacteria bacterium]